MNKYLFSMILGALTIGLSPILTKSTTLVPSTISFYRFFFGSISLFVYIFFSKQRTTLVQIRKALPFAVISGALFALDLWFWHRSIIYIGAGISTLLANTQIFYLILIGILFYKEKPTLKFYLSIALTSIGLYISSYHLLNIQNNNLIMPGIIFGLLTGVTYALVTTTLKKASVAFDKPQAFPIFLVTFFAAIFSFLICFFTNQSLKIEGLNLVYMISYGGIIHVVGWILISYALEKIQVSVAGLILLLQPITATILGIILFKEHASLFQFFGLGVSLIGIHQASKSPAN